MAKLYLDYFTCLQGLVLNSIIKYKDNFLPYFSPEDGNKKISELIYLTLFGVSNKEMLYHHCFSTLL
jgi:hypothetical protein